MKPADGGAVPSPAEFPIGSPESRAAARLLVESRGEPAGSLLLDADGNPQWDPAAIYAQHLIILPTSLSEEEWTEKYAYIRFRGKSPLGEEERKILAKAKAEEQLDKENSETWLRSFDALLREYGGAVPGRVAIARIPKVRSWRELDEVERRHRIEHATEAIALLEATKRGERPFLREALPIPRARKELAALDGKDQAAPPMVQARGEVDVSREPAGRRRYRPRARRRRW